MTNLRFIRLRAVLATTLACGTLFGVVARAQTETTVYTFANGTDGSGPMALVADGHGNFFGTTFLGTGTVFELSPASGGGWNFATLYTFPSGNPYHPRGMTIDAAGNLYGVTESGGADDAGTVFELSPNGSGGWTEATLHSFHGPDGEAPIGAPVLDQAGNLYGTTNNGGKCAASTTGCGVAFELSPQAGGSWTEKIIHRFGAFPEDGQFPFGGLVFDSHGNLYGTTPNGGLTGCSTTTCGTVFELTPTTGAVWTESILHFFHSSDGATPIDTLVLDHTGNLYGTTYMGGAHDAGVVFELKPRSGGGWALQIVHSFAHFATGEFPVAGVALDGAGNLYATTEDGGPPGKPCETLNSVAGCGSVWEFSPTSSGEWTSTPLYTFTGGADGRVLDQGPVLDGAGHLFGTALYGGASVNGGNGTIFEITP